MNYGCDVGSRRLALACATTGFVAVLRLPESRRIPKGPTFDIPQLIPFISEFVPADATLYLEHPFAGSVNRNIRTAIRLGMVVGAVIAAHRGRTEMIQQATWKKAVIGHGNADKAQVAAWLESEHPALAKACEDDQDLRDATCLALFGDLGAAGGLEDPRLLPRRGSRPVLRSRREDPDAEGAGG